MVAMCLSYVVANLIFDTRDGEGRVILVLSSEHGIHTGDLPVMLAWLLGMGGCVWLAFKG